MEIESHLPLEELRRLERVEKDATELVDCGLLFWGSKVGPLRP
jgi:hypothetical protein